jgi:GMP synthase-like glutamine amidotransferase
VAHEGPGTITGALADAGVAVRTVRLDRDEPVPSADDLGGLVVMGGPMGVHDEAGHWWIGPERA